MNGTHHHRLMRQPIGCHYQRLQNEPGVDEMSDSVFGLENIIREHEATIDQLRATNTELLEALHASEWQPIETAPKDGTRIMLWLSGPIRRPKAIFGRWCPRYSGFWMTDVGGAKPTHWMPSPDPPKQP